MLHLELDLPEPSKEIYKFLLSQALRVWALGGESEIRLHHPESDNILEQYVFAEGGEPRSVNQLTVGVILNSDYGYFKYRQQFRDGQVDPFGNVITIQHMFESGKHPVTRTYPVVYNRSPIMRLFSPISAQLVANIFRKRILDSMEIDLSDRTEREKLESMGYGKRNGYPVYDKLYIPKL